MSSMSLAITYVSCVLAVRSVGTRFTDVCIESLYRIDGTMGMRKKHKVMLTSKMAVGGVRQGNQMRSNEGKLSNVKNLEGNWEYGTTQKKGKR